MAFPSTAADERRQWTARAPGWLKALLYRVRASEPQAERACPIPAGSAMRRWPFESRRSGDAASAAHSSLQERREESIRVARIGRCAASDQRVFRQREGCISRREKPDQYVISAPVPGRRTISRRKRGPAHFSHTLPRSQRLGIPMTGPVRSAPSRRSRQCHLDLDRQEPSGNIAPLPGGQAWRRGRSEPDPARLRETRGCRSTGQPRIFLSLAYRAMVMADIPRRQIEEIRRAQEAPTRRGPQASKKEFALTGRRRPWKPNAISSGSSTRSSMGA